MILYKVQKYFPTDFSQNFIECNICSIDNFERESIKHVIRDGLKPHICSGMCIECNNFIGLIGVDLEKRTGTVICSHKNYYRLEFDENEGA